ncbi:alpha/beta fold hydrolase [Desertibaculum subflavum]|uniref:alpha/beta fold hydrolase n=1 Tax=Desertibaculum subflavum TaxID=2268458 RepID=UPI000E6706A5
MRQAGPTAQQKRAGPRPLTGQLAAANLMALTSLAALPLARSGSLAWNASLQKEAAALAPRLAAADPARLTDAVARAWAGRLEAMVRGIAAYRAHPYRRDLSDPPVVWSEGSARLLDYGPENDGPVTLFVPSLVNRAYILDLSARRSLLRHLAGLGHRPLLLDWGVPDDPRISVGDLIAGRLVRALDAAVGLAGGPVVLAGYCMGGTMATALAFLRPQLVRALALLAAPWDFHAVRPETARIGALLGEALTHLAPDGFLSVDQLQMIFLGNDPDLVVRKFQAFAAMDPASETAADFVALEDWANDGVRLAGAVARECFRDWYGDNRPAGGRWVVGGRAVRPEMLDLPALVVAPANDRLVPGPSALALATALPRAETLQPPAAHVGMVVGPDAPVTLWAPLASWLLRHGAATLRSSKPSSRRALRRAAPMG